MLAQTVRQNLKDINNLKMRTKATKFSKLFSTQPTVNEEDELVQVLAKNGLMEISADDELYRQLSISEQEPDFDNELNYVSIYDSSEDIDDFDELDDFDDIEICEEDNSEEISEYIVENPDEVVVEFPISISMESDEKLPFFRSISKKLAAA